MPAGNDTTVHGPAPAAGWRRPGTLDELRAAVNAFTGWTALERARRAPELIEAAKTVLAAERGTAMLEARNQQGVTALARDLGITRQKVYDAIARAAADTSTSTNPGNTTTKENGMPRTIKELSSDAIAQEHFALHGPYDRDQSIKAAYLIGHLVRYLNYATAEPAGLPYPAAIGDLLGSLQASVSKLPQTLQQAGQQLDRLAQDPSFVDRGMPSFWDREAEAHDVAVINAEQARFALDRAQGLAQELAGQLQDAQNLLSSIGMNTIDDDDEDDEQ